MTGASLTRRQALQLSAGGAVAVYLSACGSGGGSADDRLTFKTWEDHYLPQQLDEMRRNKDIVVKVSFADDNLTNFEQLKRGVDLDVVTADALWVPRFLEEGLIKAFDPDDFSTWRNLYPAARQVSFWKHEGGLYTCYPHAWSPHLLYYNPAEVRVPPDSWEALLDKRFRGKVVLAKEPNDILAKAGVATGAAKPFAMTDDEIARAKDYLVELKPNILKLAQAGAEEVRAFSEGAAVISTILGFDLRMKEAGGPDAKGVLAKEGTIGFADGEMISAASKRQDLIRRFLVADFQPEWIARRFLKYPHPFFDEKAYKLLVDQGHKELLDRLLYNRPELAFDESQVALVAPPPNQSAYTDAFNEVFGA